MTKALVPATLPPLSLTPDKAEALSLGRALAVQGADPLPSRPATTLGSKIAAVVPVRLFQTTDPHWVFPGAEATAAPRICRFCAAPSACRNRSRPASAPKTAACRAGWSGILGPGLDAFRLVRMAHGFPQFPR